MYQILLDSSNEYLTIGIAKNNKLIDSVFYKAWQRQSELMVYELDILLKRNNIDKKDISEIVTGIGPGSYTGVRISLTIAKTMAYACNAKLYAISSLLLLKQRKSPTICLMNARSSRSYFAVFNNGERIVEDTIVDNEYVLEYIKDHPDFIVSGDCNYLNIPYEQPNILDELLDNIKEEFLVKNIFGLKPVYLKEIKPS